PSRPRCLVGYDALPSPPPLGDAAMTFRRAAVASALAAVGGVSTLPAAPLGIKPPKPRVEVVFCLDTTGSMGGLIEGAKQKIWSISNQSVFCRPGTAVKISRH